MHRYRLKMGGVIMLLSLLFLVLYCEKKHGTGRPLQDFSQYLLPEPPTWARQGVLYEIFLRNFTPDGTFRAAEARLPELKKLDVDILWLMPIHPVGKKGRKGSLGSPYSVRDYLAIDSAYGSAADFRHFVETAHRMGFRVIMDMVTNHCANDNPLIRQHPDWFVRDRQGNPTREVADWSDVTDFNYENREVWEYMIQVLTYWVREFDIDGYRCDVAGMVPYEFWKEALDSLRKVKPDIFLLAEWEDPRILLQGFHSDYDWTLYHLLKDIRACKKRSAEAVTLVEEKDSRYPRNALPMRFLENHDEQRALEVFGAPAIQAYARLIFTLPGIPLLYAGQEIGATHRPTLFEKDPVNWAEADTMLWRMYRQLIQLRKSHSCFTQGDFVPLPVTMLSGSVGAYLRADAHSVAVVICNLKNQPAENVFVSVPEEWKEQLSSLTFTSLDDPGEQFTIDRLWFKNIEPFTTLILMGSRAQE